MARKRITVQQLAHEAQVEVDEALVLLWDAGFDYLKDATDRLRRGGTNRARRILGLATRRELSTSQYWQAALRMSHEQFEEYLPTLGIPRPFEHGRLRVKAVNRLKAELRARGAFPRTYTSEPATQSEASLPPLRWHTIGHVRESKQLSAEDVLAVHDALVADFATSADPISPSGLKSRDLLESAVHRPATGIAGTSKYPTVEMAAAALVHALVHNHPFHNGNKRTALVAMLVFLDKNNLVLTCDEDDLFKFVLRLAQHALIPSTSPSHELADRETLAVAHWIDGCSRILEKGDRAVTWRQLRRILSRYGCSFSFPGGTGNRINVTRTVERRTRFLKREVTDTLKTQTYYGDEGRDVEKNTIHKIRQDLALDDEHGIDSSAFYDDESAPSGEFIVRYRKTLRRLARL